MDSLLPKNRALCTSWSESLAEDRTRQHREGCDEQRREEEEVGAQVCTKNNAVKCDEANRRAKIERQMNLGAKTEFQTV